MGFSAEDREYILAQVEQELDYLDETEIQTYKRNKHAFGEWVRETVRSAAESLGYYLTLPFKLVGDFIKGLWEGLFG